MSEITFQKQVLNRLSHLERGINNMKQELDIIKQRVVDDKLLSQEDKNDIDLAIKEDKKAKLLSKKQVFG